MISADFDTGINIAKSAACFFVLLGGPFAAACASAAPMPLPARSRWAPRFLTAASLAAAAVSCALPSALAATVSVTAFGAVGDGVTDDFAAVNTALASLNGSGTLLFPSASSSSAGGVTVGGRYALSQPLVVSGYAVHLVGEGARPALASRDGAGSSLLALSGNSSLVVFDLCTFCSLRGMLLSHAVEPGAPPRRRLTPRCSAAGDSNRTCEAHLRRVAQAWTLARPDLSLLSTVNSKEAAAAADAAVGAAAATVTPTSGAAVTVRRSFQVTLDNLWIDSVFRMVWVTNFANTVTLLDSQLSNVFGDCCAFVRESLPGDGGALSAPRRVLVRCQPLPS